MLMHTNNYEQTWPAKETLLNETMSMYNTSRNIYGLKLLYKMSHNERNPTQLTPYQCIQT